MIRILHPIAGLTGMVIISGFWTATVLAEAFGSAESVVAVKAAVLWGLLLLVPALAITAISGFRLAGHAVSPLIARKRRRMPFIALNGLLVLVPSAVFLYAQAADGNFGAEFAMAQTVELLAGLLNLVLMALNMRDGRQLAKQFSPAVK